MSEPTTVHFDFEFGFLSGETQFFSAVEGRDKIAADDARVRLELHPDDATVEEVIVHRSALSYMRTTKRTVTAEPTFDQKVELTLVGKPSA